jgi:HlyD family secretion protein
MIAQRSKLFRKEALERNASPERLDQLVQIVNPKRWLSLVALGGLVSGGVAWSVLGQIPITVRGQGILTYPSQVAPLQSSASGRIKEILVQEGEQVNAGDVIALLDQSELEKQLELAKLTLEQLRDQENMANLLQTQRGGSEQITLAQQRLSLQQQITAAQALTPVLRAKAQASIQQQRTALQARAATLTPMLATYRERWQSRQRVNDEAGYLIVSRDEILQTEQAYRDVQQELDQIQTQLSQLALEETNAQQDYAQNLNKITGFAGTTQSPGQPICGPGRTGFNRQY